MRFRITALREALLRAAEAIMLRETFLFAKTSPVMSFLVSPIALVLIILVFEYFVSLVIYLVFGSGGCGVHGFFINISSVIKIHMMPPLSLISSLKYINIIYAKPAYCDFLRYMPRRRIFSILHFSSIYIT